MATLAQLRAGLADRLETIASLKGIYEESPGQVETPAAVIRMGSPAITYGTSMAGGSHDYTFSILVLVSTAQGAPASKELDSYLDPTGTDSVLAAMEAGPTLGGIVAAATLTSCAQAGLVEYPSGSGIHYLGAELLVAVLA